MPDSSLIRERRIGFIGGLLRFCRQHGRGLDSLRADPRFAALKARRYP